MSKEQIQDLAQEANAVDISEAQSHYLIQCEDVRLISSMMRPIVFEEDTSEDSRFAFHIQAIVDGNNAYSYLEVQAKYLIAGEPEAMQGYNIRFVLMGTFLSKEELPPEAFENFIKMYTLSILWPYAREYTSDQLRRTGENDIALPIINPQVVAEQLIENDMIEVEIIKKPPDTE